MGRPSDQNSSGVEPRAQATSFLRTLSSFGLILAACWLVLLSLHLALPGIRAGADRVYEAKNELIASGLLFDPASEIRLIVFGNSRVLAGFVPEVFDRALARTSSFNAGIPEADYFVDELEVLVDRGHAPTHVLLTNCWGSRTQTSETAWARDEQIVEWLFPFRRLVRNGSLFLLRSMAHGGPRAYYALVEARLEKMVEDRGYHFIESQSHYPGHRLPTDYRTELDDPNHPQRRRCEPIGPEFERLLDVKKRAGLFVAMVPTYFREFEVSEAQPNDGQRVELERFGIEVLGPDYYRFPNRLFSDKVHLNSEGATLYSKRLAELVAEVLPGSAPRSRSARAAI